MHPRRPFPPSPRAEIVDLSSNNGLPRWNEATTVKLAILRATMGNAGVDTALAHNASGTQAVGIPAAYYHLFRPEDSGASQARHFLDTVGDKPYVFLAVDVEQVVDTPISYYRENKLQITARLHELVVEIRKATGVYPYIYTGAWFWDVYIAATYDDTFSKCLLWVAEYGDKVTRIPRGWQTYSLWQYTSEGNVPGIDDKTIDLNRERTVASAAFSLVLPVNASATLVQRNLFGANPDNYKTFGLSGHDGLDYAGALDDPIYAAADGKVKLVAKDTNDPKNNPYGNQVRLTHEVNGETYETIYAHLNKFVPDLKAGDTVKAGQQIGYMGSTGNSDGVHLHLAVKWLGSTAKGYKQTLPDGRTLVFEKDLVNPQPLLKAA